MSTVVILGNNAPRNPLHPALNQSETRVELWDGIDDAEMVKLAVSTDNDRALVQRHAALADEHKHYAVALHEIEELWPAHSAATRPAYVASSDPELQKALAAYYGCPEGQYVALQTNGGIDGVIAQMLGTSAQPAAFNYMAISTSTGSGFAATDTTLASELTANGLGRAQGTYAHTAGTTTATLTHTWTYTGSTSTVIASMGVLNASSAGTLGWEDALSSSITVAANGDTATVTYTLTA